VKGAFGVEAIGLRTSERMIAKRLNLLKGATPWVAELVGLSDRYGYERRFVPYKSDWARANGTGSRGVWLWWTLDAGSVYETRYRTSWALSSWTHRFLTVTDAGDVIDIGEDEVRARLTQPRLPVRSGLGRRVVRRVLR
jgi:hypothetical protein